MKKEFGDVYVSESKLHGLGIFANRDFKKGEKIFDWDFTVLTREEYEDLPENLKEYVSEIGGEYKLLNEPFRYMNWSRENNTTPGDGFDTAVRDIKKDEEITSDYNGENVDTTNFN